MNTIRNDRSNLFRLLAATIFFAVGIISTTHAQLNNLGVFNEYYSDYVLVDSIAVTCKVHLPEGDSASMGITNYHITFFSGNEEKQIFDLESLGRYNLHLREEICMRYIPETYSRFMDYSKLKNLKKGDSYIITIQLFPKAPLNDLSSTVVQNILSVCSRLSCRLWALKWHLSYTPPKELAALREFAFRRIPEGLLLENEYIYVVELQPNPISYYRGQLLFVAFPSSRKIFEFREYDPETRTMVIPASPEQSVLELIERVTSGDSLPTLSPKTVTDTSRYYNVLVIRRIGKRFSPLSYEPSGVLFDPLPADLRNQLEELLE